MNAKELIRKICAVRNKLLIIKNYHLTENGTPKDKLTKKQEKLLLKLVGHFDEVIDNI